MRAAYIYNLYYRSASAKDRIFGVHIIVWENIDSSKVRLYTKYPRRGAGLVDGIFFLVWGRTLDELNFRRIGSKSIINY